MRRGYCELRATVRQHGGLVAYSVPNELSAGPVKSLIVDIRVSDI
jgi:hypothetical protein